MSSNASKPSGASTIIGIVVGILLMLGGSWLTVQWHHEPPAWVQQLADQGIPIDPGATVAALGVLLILFPVIRIFFITPLADAIHTRTSDLERIFSEAEELRGRMETMKTDYERRLADKEAEAREQIKAEIAKAQELGKQLRREAELQAEEMRRKAQAEIDAEMKRVMNELRLHVVDMTLLATERILGENVDDERNRRLVQDFIDKVEVPS
jgi:F-type H+-transporting ATPase subunit b